MNARNPKRKATTDLSELEKLNRHKENLLTVAVASAAGQTHSHDTSLHDTPSDDTSPRYSQWRSPQVD